MYACVCMCLNDLTWIWPAHSLVTCDAFRSIGQLTGDCVSKSACLFNAAVNCGNYVCMYACMRVCMYVCMHVCVSMYVCMFLCFYEDCKLHMYVIQVEMIVGYNAYRTFQILYMYVCMHVCMCVFMYFNEWRSVRVCIKCFRKPHIPICYIDIGDEIQAHTICMYVCMCVCIYAFFKKQ